MVKKNVQSDENDNGKTVEKIRRIIHNEASMTSVLRKFSSKTREVLLALLLTLTVDAYLASQEGENGDRALLGLLPKATLALGIIVAGTNALVKSIFDGRRRQSKSCRRNFRQLFDHVLETEISRAIDNLDGDDPDFADALTKMREEHIRDDERQLSRQKPPGKE